MGSHAVGGQGRNGDTGNSSPPNSSVVLDNLNLWHEVGGQHLQAMKEALAVKDQTILKLSERNQDLVNLVAQLREDLVQAERRGVAAAEGKINQLIEEMKAGIRIALGGVGGGGSDISFGDEQDGTLACGDNVSGGESSSKSQDVLSSSSTTSDELEGSLDHSNGSDTVTIMDEMVSKRADPVDHSTPTPKVTVTGSTPGGHASTKVMDDPGSSQSVTWDKLSLDDQEKVKKILRGSSLAYCENSLLGKLDGPILTKLMSGTMPGESVLFESIILNQYREYEAKTSHDGVVQSQVELINSHVKLSLDDEFPNSAAKLVQSFPPISRDDMLKLGLVKIRRVDGRLEFIASILPKYFICRWIVEKLLNGDWDQEMDSFLFATVLKVDRFHECYDTDCEDAMEEDEDPKRSHCFCDCHDDEDNLWGEDDRKHPFCQVLANDGIVSLLNALVGELLQSLMHSSTINLNILSQQDIGRLGEALAHHHHPNLLKLLLHTGSFKDPKLAKLLFSEATLAVAARKGRLDIFLLAKSACNNLNWLSDDLKVKGLRKAVAAGNFDLVDFLVNQVGMKEMLKGKNEDLQDIIHECVEYTENGNDELVGKRVLILQCLVQCNPALLENSCDRDEGEGTPLLCCEVHFRLVEELIKLGANVGVKTRSGDTALHLYAGLSSEYYGSILKTIPEESLKALINDKERDGDTPLLTHFKWSQPTSQIVEFLGSVGADMNAINEKGYSVLSTAIKAGKDNSDAIIKLISLGANIQWTGGKGETLLHLGSANGKLAAVELLLQKGMAVNCKDKEGLTPLDYAIKGAHLETAVALRNAGGQFNQVRNDRSQSLLHLSAKDGNSGRLGLLLQLGLFNVNEGDAEGHTALHWAVIGGGWRQSEIVKLLLNNKANPNGVNQAGEVPLLLGLKKKSISLNTFQLLNHRTNLEWTPSLTFLVWELIISETRNETVDELEAILAAVDLGEGEYYRCKNESGDSLLHVATLKRNEAAVRFLVENGMDINVRNKKGETPLHATNYFKDKDVTVEMAKFLINNGAEVNAKDAEGYTFLHRFIKANDLQLPRLSEVAEFLWLRDCINPFNIKGGPLNSTPFQEALARPRLELSGKTLTTWKSHGVDFNVLDMDGDSVLAYAVKGQRDRGILSKLLDFDGVNLTHGNFKGQTLLHIASQVGNWMGVAFLLERGLDVDGVDREGNTPLHSLMQDGKRNMLGVARRLIEKGAGISSRNRAGLTPLEILLKREDEVVSDELKKLLGEGDARDKEEEEGSESN